MFQPNKSDHHLVFECLSYRYNMAAAKFMVESYLRYKAAMGES